MISAYVTHNALSLRSKHQLDTALAQLEQSHFHIVGFQEARRSRTAKRVIHDGQTGKASILVSSSAREDGSGGCAIVLFLSRPFFVNGKSSLNICLNDVVVCHSCPRCLIIVISCHGSRFAVASIHAPDQTSPTYISWWGELRKAFMTLAKLPTIICIDCNTTMPEVLGYL